MAVEYEEYGLFAWSMELTFAPIRLKNGFRDQVSWNTILRVAKMSYRDFPDDYEDNFNAA